MHPTPAHHPSVDVCIKQCLKGGGVSITCSRMAAASASQAARESLRAASSLAPAMAGLRGLVLAAATASSFLCSRSCSSPARHLNHRCSPYDANAYGSCFSDNVICALTESLHRWHQPSPLSCSSLRDAPSPHEAKPGSQPIRSSVLHAAVHDHDYRGFRKSLTLQWAKLRRLEVHRLSMGGGSAPLGSCQLLLQPVILPLQIPHLQRTISSSFLWDHTVPYSDQTS